MQSCRPNCMVMLPENCLSWLLIKVVALSQVLRPLVTQWCNTVTVGHPWGCIYAESFLEYKPVLCVFVSKDLQRFFQHLACNYAFLLLYIAIWGWCDKFVRLLGIPNQNNVWMGRGAQEGMVQRQSYFLFLIFYSSGVIEWGERLWHRHERVLIIFHKQYPALALCIWVIPLEWT